MKYSQLSIEERSLIGWLRSKKWAQAEIARVLNRSPSTISREVRRNAYPTDGGYKALHAQSMANGRRRRARQGSQIDPQQWKKVVKLLRRDYSPEQVAGLLRRTGALRISHETIYRYVWQDKAEGGDLHSHLRGARKQRRKRYGAYDSRGRLAGKRMIGERPSAVESREAIGHWEVDTVHGGDLASVVTLVERKTGFVQIGQLDQRTIAQTNRRLRMLMKRHPGSYQTITADNGCEFHGYRALEERGEATFYFANPHHSWERGTNENTNGLIRQYLPKGKSMAFLNQKQCDAIAKKLNDRPRKRHGYYAPSDLFTQII